MYEITNSIIFHVALAYAQAQQPQSPAVQAASPDEDPALGTYRLQKGHRSRVFTQEDIPAQQLTADTAQGQFQQVQEQLRRLVGHIFH